MKDDSKHIDLFDRYIDQHLSDTEVSQFEEMLQKDPALKESFEQHLMIRKRIELEGMHTKLNDWHDELCSQVSSKQEPPGKRKNRLWWGLIALIGMILLFFLMRGMTNQVTETTPDEIYAAYYYPDPGLPISMGESTDQIFTKGMQAYKRGDYKQALDYWSAVNDPGNLQDVLDYYMGSTYLAMGNIDIGLVYFNKVPEGSDYFLKSQWYSLLVSIKLEDWETSRTVNNALLESEIQVHREDLEGIREILESIPEY